MQAYHLNTQNMNIKGGIDFVDNVLHRINIIYTDIKSYITQLCKNSLNHYDLFFGFQIYVNNIELTIQMILNKTTWRLAKNSTLFGVTYISSYLTTLKALLS